MDFIFPLISSLFLNEWPVDRYRPTNTS